MIKSSILHYISLKYYFFINFLFLSQIIYLFSLTNLSQPTTPSSKLEAKQVENPIKVNMALKLGPFKELKKERGSRFLSRTMMCRLIF